MDHPHTKEYSIDQLIPGKLIRVDFKLGFREEQRISLLFRKVVEDMVKNKEVNITSRYESLQRNNVVGDFQFVVMEKFLSHDNELPFYERIIMRLYFLIKKVGLSEERGFGLDQSNVAIEKFPLIVAPVSTLKLTRIYRDEDVE
jgi:KUP system potassium uptake protein